MNHSDDDGLWPAVVVNSRILIAFAFSLNQPQTKRDWRSLASASAHT